MRICPRCSELFPDDAGFCPLDGTRLKKATDPYLGRTIAGRFRLVKRLGAGGMSTVYLARHVMIDRLSAIKILRDDLGLNPSHRERFLREARAVNRINHHNIVEITDFGEGDGIAYLVMEYIAGESLLSHLRRGVFPWERAARVAIQVAAALGRAHQMGVVHRDLKPENVMLVPDPAGHELVKLTDFGIAKILDAPALTFSEQMFGTPGYIAPEYLEGLVPDGRADLYALGIVLYEMISGVLPYDAKGQSEMLFAPLKSAPIPLGTRVNGLPPEIESLVLRLLARQREERPADAFLVHDALEDVLRRRGDEGAPPGARPLSLLPGVQRDMSPTLVDDALSASGAHASAASIAGALGASTANLEGLQTSDMGSRWKAALEELEVAIVRGLKRGGRRLLDAERARDLAERARELVEGVERASSRVAEYQARVDRLEATARDFRANLGRAVDELVRDRARERVHAAAIRARKDRVDAPVSTSAPVDSARIWEGAALAVEGERADAIERDLTFQIATLQKQLETKNAEVDASLVEATAMLEGAISGTRRLTHELVRTLDEAANALRH
jgi:eukaryotic-like serine/threonine-protein kinase